ncbi:MAG: hypothetical protein UU48_C0004G0024 [Candidatus Uhrbacteria bacterium GW2011_GWF2_41_16]|uniref:Uncharacterized protein n=2 Tax=Candidatus Uhriibacteriota TaxID=1752732 RepID=A0A0G0VF01_9BACT|nr:MAG: hypothetical protein UU35_C0010G0003 [Candidatus Uhrbacteria bacterium GW2011_GWC2_41_11]KKR98231.1 MAG: hypothetical protein UU48_C0004G0024 [Candidatus Uhrbacteria bacterium GW2011_GWF2_41_16]HBP00010.1 hypothetical protein [Candidatus Uhrbacteria bacterium]
MEMEYVRQSARDTTYTMFQGKDVETFDPEKLHVIQRANMEIRSLGVHIDAAIIGESHFVRIEKNGQLILVEMLACVNLDELGFKTERSWQLSRINDHLISMYFCRDYTITTNVHILEPRTWHTTI